MSKTIKLEGGVYQRLEEIRGKRETFSQAVERLISVMEGFKHLTDITEGTKEYHSWKDKQGAKQEAPVD